ncbi:hypothetical protein KDD93_07405 [Campylobacter sp. faydin G-24]|uniref:Uncharacterized protein n=1 Tax=Campylobacter anatolicus TaxID=2829105 RepID=A0ABS5HJG0_9BACT|nr:hypothetical protein [Campylobacter anatolicus]MBR8464388.1 hypothetical protein [Campylobacter anatolicus]
MSHKTIIALLFVIYAYASESSSDVVRYSGNSSELCYDEVLEIKKINETEFIPVGFIATAKSGDILRTKLEIKTIKDVRVSDVTLKATIDTQSAEYIQNSSYVANAPTTEVFNVTQMDKISDIFVQIPNDNALYFRVGKGAQNNGDAIHGGSLDKTTKAIVQLDMSLRNKFKRTSFEVLYKNEETNHKKQGRIGVCGFSSHLVFINDDDDNIDNIMVVNKNFKTQNDNTNLFTQIANKAFDVNLISFDRQNKAFVSSQANSNISIDVVSSYDECKNSQNVLEGGARSVNLDNENLITLKNLVINKAYPELHFRISYLDKNTNKIKQFCQTEPFAVRPKELVLYDINTEKPLSSDELIGAKIYNHIGLKATNANNDLALNYSNSLENIKFMLKLPRDCNTSIAFLDEISLKADFINGKAKLKNLSFQDIGEVYIQGTDSTYTALDQAQNDCIADSDSNIEAEGKIGCNIPIKKHIIKFIPKDIMIDNFKIKNFQNGTMTYLNSLSNNHDMYASATFDITARLNDNTVAKMYSTNCYAKDVGFEIDLNATQKSDIFYIPNSALIKKDQNKKDNKFTALKSIFLNGVANGEIEFNFKRDSSKKSNPFEISSDEFKFINITDGKIIGAIYEKPAEIDKTSAKFYYGRIYVPLVQGVSKTLEAKAYYSVYCNNCDTQRYKLSQKDKDWQRVPHTNGWFINEFHTNDQGRIDSYEQKGKKVVVSSNIIDGIQALNISKNGYSNDTIRAEVPNWLIYNEFDKKANKIEFNIKFKSSGNWAGSAKNGVGSIVGDKSLKDATNRRIQW